MIFFTPTSQRRQSLVMIRYIKILISMLFLAITLYRQIFGRTERGLTILYYHSVPASSAEMFLRQMRLLARFTEVVPASWEGDTRVPPKKRCFRPVVAITFDDAMQSVFDHALPILNSLQIPATIFVPSGWMGQVPGWQIESISSEMEPVASDARIAQMNSALVTIGSHTVSHPHLSALSADSIEAELQDSRDALRALIGQPVDLLAFPYGDFDERVLRLSAGCGYRYVFTIKPQLIMPKSGQLERGRVAVEPDDLLCEFILKSLGAYRWMPAASWVKARLRSYVG